MLMRFNKKVMEQCATEATDSEVNYLAASHRVSEYVGQESFDKNSTITKKISDTALFETCKEVVNLSMQSLIDFEKLKSDFCIRQEQIEKQIKKTHEMFEQVNSTKLSQLTSFISADVTKEDLSTDIVTQLNEAFAVAFSQVNLERERTTQFFADELQAHKTNVEEHRNCLYTSYTNAQQILAGEKVKDGVVPVEVEIVDDETQATTMVQKEEVDSGLEMSDFDITQYKSSFMTPAEVDQK